MTAFSVLRLHWRSRRLRRPKNKAPGLGTFRQVASWHPRDTEKPWLRSVKSPSGDRDEIKLPAYREIIAMIKTFKPALFVFTALALGAGNLSANAQAQGPGSGGMMGGGEGWGWGMGGGMGGFGGIGLLLVVLLVVGFALLAVRRRNP